MGSACVGAAGPFLLPIFYVAPEVGMDFTILSFLAIILGGMGNFLGALLGGLILGMTQALGATFLTGSLANFLFFIIFIIVLLFKPHGILGGRR
jgi:branched-chain amino acid transport system permease protein